MEDWWLRAEGRLFGPYSAQQLFAYREQGRFAATSLVGRSRDGPFAPAATWPALAQAFSAPRPFGGGSGEPQPPPLGAERPLLVLAALRETRPDAVEQVLNTLGPSVRIKGTLWLARVRMPAAALRNALSRRLASDEFLLVAEADLAAAAWFNLDGEADRALRRLWSAG